MDNQEPSQEAGYAFADIAESLAYPDAFSEYVTEVMARPWPADKTLVHTIQG